MFLQGVPISENPNLLQNPDFEQVEASGEPRIWSSYGIIVLENSSNRVYSGQYSLKLHGPQPPEAYGFVYQEIPVTGGQTYTVGYWVYAEKPVVISLQIYWLDENHNKFGEQTDWQETRPGWNFYSMSGDAPADARFAHVFANVNGDGIAWFDELCFVSGLTCP